METSIKSLKNKLPYTIFFICLTSVKRHSLHSLCTFVLSKFCFKIMKIGLNGSNESIHSIANGGFSLYGE